MFLLCSQVWMRSSSSCCWFGMNYTWSKTPCWWTSRTSPGDEAHNEDLHRSKFINYVTGRESQVCSFSRNKHHIYHFRVFFSVKFFEKVLPFQLTFHCKQTLCSLKKKKKGRAVLKIDVAAHFHSPVAPRGLAWKFPTGIGFYRNVQLYTMSASRSFSISL